MNGYRVMTGPKQAHTVITINRGISGATTLGWGALEMSTLPMGGYTNFLPRALKLEGLLNVLSAPGIAVSK